MSMETAYNMIMTMKSKVPRMMNTLMKQHPRAIFPLRVVQPRKQRSLPTHMPRERHLTRISG